MPGGEQQPNSKEGADPVEAIRAAREAEVHGVGVSDPPAYHLRNRDVADWRRLGEALQADHGPGRRVREMLPKETQKGLEDDQIVSKLGDRSPTEPVFIFRAALLGELEKVLKRDDLYTEGAFKGVELGKDVKALVALGKDRNPVQTLRLNRALLAAGFPGAVAEVPPDYHAVRVKVSEGKAVVLVLSSSRTCRWEVEVEKGAEVKGVVLHGAEYQEVAGVGDAPVAYRAERGRDGQRIPGNKYSQGYNPKAESFKLFADAIKDLTGRDFTSYQGVYQAPKDGFVARPSVR